MGKEDFVTLAERTKDTAGVNFKYDYSYEEAAALIRKFVPAWRVEIEKFFSVIVFNYLFSNGDAHLKNFGLLETESSDYFLSPAYDLINTRIHVDETDFALDKGLFADKFESEAFKRHITGEKRIFWSLPAEFALRAAGRIDCWLPSWKSRKKWRC